MVKIANLTIQGFRSLRFLSWSPSHLNRIIGPNGSLFKSDELRPMA